METNLDQLQYIDNFLYDNLSKIELRDFIYELLSDESFIRSFRLYASMKGAIV